MFMEYVTVCKRLVPITCDAGFTSKSPSGAYRLELSGEKEGTPARQYIQRITVIDSSEWQEL